jgi:hypothetical protein
MPNHTANNFTVTGPKADVLRFVAQAKGTDSELDFNKLLPMPEELKGISSPVNIMTQDEIDELWSEWNERKSQGKLGEFDKERPFGLGLTRERSEELISKYGTYDWYDWRVCNWGTKWNAYDVTEWSINEGHWNGENSSATIYYETAWSPATALWLNMSKDYPTLDFYHEFADEGGSFLGSETIRDGRIISEEELDWDSDDGIELREGLGRYWPEDDEDEVEVVKE